MIKNTVYQFVGSTLWVRYFWEGTSEKRCIEMEDWGFPVHLALGLTDSWFQKSYEGFEQLQTSIRKSKKLKLDGILSKKYIPSPETLYTEDLFNITFSYFCENSPNYLCHFRTHRSFFTTQLLCIIVAQTLRTFYKSSPSKCKFSDFLLLRVKFTEFLMSFFKWKVSFSS